MINPFIMLSVDKTISKNEIMKKVSAAMREAKYDMKTIATAQKILFNPMTRATAEFMFSIDTKACIEQMPDNVSTGEPDIKMLEIFDEKTPTPK